MIKKCPACQSIDEYDSKHNYKVTDLCDVHALKFARKIGKKDDVEIFVLKEMAANWRKKQ